MPLITRSEIAFAILSGGLIGALTGLVVSMMFDIFPLDFLELVAAAWTGFVLACALILIRNASPGRRRAD